jgi:hypothetical protein
MAEAPIAISNVNRKIGLVYRDAQSAETERVITVHGAQADDARITMLEGYCHLQRGPRSFRTDRILRAYDPETGELIPDLGAWLGAGNAAPLSGTAPPKRPAAGAGQTRVVPPKKGGGCISTIVGTLGVCAVLILLVVAAANFIKPGSQTAANQPQPVVAPPASTTPQPVALPLPAGEQAVLRVVRAEAQRYEAAPNEMARGAIRPERARALCAALPGGAAQNWAGTIETLTSNNAGDGVLAIRLDGTTIVKTWNNSFSDIGDRTLIAAGSPLHAQVAAMRTGQAVIFSGQLLRGDDCFHEASLTMSGGMRAPEFLMRFTAVRPAD